MIITATTNLTVLFTTTPAPPLIRMQFPINLKNNYDRIHYQKINNNQHLKKRRYDLSHFNYAKPALWDKTFYHMDASTVTNRLKHQNLFERTVRAKKRNRRQADEYGWVVSLATNVLRLVSFLYGIATDSTKQEQPDRIDTQSSLPSSSSSSLGGGVETSDNDVALGTLMAFGGKYLRKLTIWAWEFGSDLSKENSGSYLQDLSSVELQKLAELAVKAGADPIKLQLAFKLAESTGDWTNLEALINKAIGSSAASSGNQDGIFNNVLNTLSSSVKQVASTVTNIFTGTSGPEQNVNKIGIVSENSPSSTYSTVNNIEDTSPLTGIYYYIDQANTYQHKLDRIWNGNTEDENDILNEMSMIQRFIKEFSLEKNAFQLQEQANTIIRGINAIFDDKTEADTRKHFRRSLN